MFLRDTDAGILHPQKSMSFMSAYFYHNAAVFIIITNGVITEIIYKFRYHFLIGSNTGRHANTRDIYLIFVGIHFQIVHASLCQLIQIKCLRNILSHSIIQF